MLRKSGIIAQDVNCPELPGERCKPLLDGSRIGNIHPNRCRFDPFANELFGHAINRLALVDQPDGGALRTEIAAQSLPDTTRCTRNRDYFAVKHHRAASSARSPSAIQPIFALRK